MTISSREGLWAHSRVGIFMDLGVPPGSGISSRVGIFFDPGYLGVSARGGLLCECRDFRGIQAIVANLQEFWESRGGSHWYIPAGGGRGAVSDCRRTWLLSL